MQKLSVAVMNFSGNVGKTTVARHLLAPRIPGSRVVSVETINADGLESKTIKGDRFSQLQEYMLSGASVVVDIGASNVEAFLAAMDKFAGSHLDFDFFVIPTTSKEKQQMDTIATLLELSERGIAADRILVVFNMVDHPDEIEEDFAAVLNFLRSKPIAICKPDWVITTNEIFTLARNADGSLAQIQDLAEDQTDYKRLIAQTDDSDERIRLARRLGTTRLARGMVTKLDDCFEAMGLHD